MIKINYINDKKINTLIGKTLYFNTLVLYLSSFENGMNNFFKFFWYMDRSEFVSSYKYWGCIPSLQP